MSDVLSIFAFDLICGQGRCFVVDGAALPLCQRCLGLYLGALLTAGWMVGSRAWRWGLPPRSVLLMQSFALLLAMLGGLHVIDTGPSWRFACGLWTGHVALAWMAGAAACLWHPGASPPWRASHRLQAIAFPGLLALLASGSSWIPGLPWIPWAILAAIGAGSLLAGMLASLMALACAAARARWLGGLCERAAAIPPRCSRL